MQEDTIDSHREIPIEQIEHKDRKRTTKRQKRKRRRGREIKKRKRKRQSKRKRKIQRERERERERYSVDQVTPELSFNFAFLCFMFSQG